MSASIVIEAPTVRRLARARRICRENEPRDVAYRVATELVRLLEDHATEVTEAQALAVLLQSWNMAYYRAHPFTAKHFTGLGRLLRSHAETLASCRHRSIEDLNESDRDVVARLFGAFETLLGRVGAAKALHLLAPRFFPLWDNPIARERRIRLVTGANNWPVYWQFMQATQIECLAVGGEARHGRDLLKQLDEFYYCRAQGWM